MTSKFAIKSLLAVSLSVVSTIASAVLYPQSTSSTTCTLAMRIAVPKQCSIRTEGVLKGLGNTILNPTAYRVRILIEEGYVFWTNPAGQSEQGGGTPFGNIQVQLDGSGLISAEQLDKKGRTLEDIVFHEDDLVGGIVDGLTASCNLGNAQACNSLAQISSQLEQHPNWIPWTVITKLQVLGQELVQSSSPNCNISGGVFTDCTVADALGQKPCVAPNAVIANPKSFIGKEFDYACTTVCRDKTGPACPPGFPLP